MINWFSPYKLFLKEIAVRLMKYRWYKISPKLHLVHWNVSVSESSNALHRFWWRYLPPNLSPISLQHLPRTLISDSELSCWKSEFRRQHCSRSSSDENKATTALTVLCLIFIGRGSQTVPEFSEKITWKFSQKFGDFPALRSLFIRWCYCRRYS